ncbi:peptidoglycan-binding protein [Rhizohabitans arisaemae]|uniref:peptidoglycan-binding protein n=1 Tax=Rhizohabitans arisaemae TaxID=2720610 RepID=UPI0024B26920|nr:peptidoglycan-binding protein [Rhizohabitans arisaemae]
MKRSPRRTLSVIVGGVVVLAGVGWGVGTRLRSPADEAAARRPPNPSLVTAPVVRQTLTSSVAMQGQLAYGSPLSIFLAGTVGGAASGGSEPGASSVQRATRVPPAGTRLRNGSVFMEVGGRPVFALKGDIPMYRALEPGTEGPDVKQLQRALAGLGFSPGRISGVFDAGTAAAVRRWYAKKGYRAQEPGPEERQALRDLERAVDQAREALVADERTLGQGGDQRLIKLKIANSERNLARAKEALAEFEAYGESLETRERRESLRRAVQSAREEVLAAEQALAAAKPEDDKRLLELRLQGARENLAAAEQALADFEERGHEADEQKLQQLRQAVETAEEALLADKQQLKLSKDVKLLKLKIANGKRSLGAAQAALAVARTRYGLSVPAGEVVFLPAFPARLDKVSVKAGDPVTGKVATVTGASVTVPGFIPEQEARLLRKGLPATIETAAGRTFKAAVTAIGKEAEQSDGPKAPEGQSAVPILLTAFDSGPLRALTGSAVTATVQVGASAGKVLTVPVAAVFTSADGTARVKLQTGENATKDVPIVAGLAADGNVEVKPVEQGALKEGDRVVVGAVT